MRHRNPIVLLFNLILHSGREEMFGDSQSVIAVCTRLPVPAAETSVLTGVWPWHYYSAIKLADLISFSESKKNENETASCSLMFDSL